MHSLIEAHGTEDDWSGLGDAKLRRKLQTRLNVRAHRKRKALAAKACHAVEDKTVVAHVEVVAAPTRKTSIRLSKRLKANPTFTSSTDTCKSLSSIPCQDVDVLFPRSVNLAESGPCRLSLAAQALMDLAQMPDKPRDEVWGHQHRRNQRTDFVFCLPLSSDHLIVVVQFNVLRGLVSNMATLNRLAELEQHYPEEKPPLFPGPDSYDGMPDDYQGDMSECGGNGSHHHKWSIPQDLMPTALQRSAAHGSWIDYAPSGALRDNLIRHEHSLDHDELLRDILGSVCTKPSMCGEPKRGGEEGCGLIVWRDPWSPSGWEFSEGFAKKWWFLLRGCTDLLESTNRWRSTRGEEPLVIDL